ncbi:unnamed protein product [Rotaria socialis]|uniref:TIR domain-containing protein n=2 Tax=Rotaria socialis TaxID=392032 RepID=A0A818NHM7_9BILA|nr:unnamed protein product [Rotaria socialis]CAF3606865.1 unnamed protein product [Rotaria socialis]CAF4428592.1 unnamed protein product [Rotaria socialis]
MDKFYFNYRNEKDVSPRSGLLKVQKSVETLQQTHTPPGSSQLVRLSNLKNSINDKDPKTMSKSELKKLLNSVSQAFNQVNDKNKEETLPIIAKCIIKISGVQESALLSVLQHPFVSSLQAPFIDLLHRWRNSSSISNGEAVAFLAVVKLIKKLVKYTDDTRVLPSWLFDSTFLHTIADCLTDIATSRKYFDEKHFFSLKRFTRLIRVYTHCQLRWNDHNDNDKDKLVILLGPIIQRLTSSRYAHIFTNTSKNTTKMTIIEKFYLLRCPSFLISYNGSCLEETMEDLLATMLPKYITILNKIVPLVNDWKRPMIQAVNYLLKIIDHGADRFPKTAKLVSGNLKLIDHVLALVNEPLFYDNLQKKSSIETNFMNTALDFLVNMRSDPAILAHMKQALSAPIFLRLTSCEHKSLALHANNLLAYTMHEEDIKAMPNPGLLLKNNIKILKTTINKKSDDHSNTEQQLETLKGLIQHDQIRDELVKQNDIPFLLKCADTLTGKSYALVLEILWSLSFRDECAAALRSNSKFLKHIETVSKTTDDEQIKKSIEGLTWVLVENPVMLERRAKRESEEKNEATPEMITVTEEIVKSDGTKELLTVTKPAPQANRERKFQYDIMISYCHADKELICKIHKFLLAEGFLVWIDLNNMFGPAMSAMADAVENSEFVLVCMSDSYKQSTYCQAEAEYAFSCKRRLVPLKVRPRYRADGWLGFMIGSRIYIDFGALDFETACKKLIAEIARQSQRPLPSKAAAAAQPKIPIEAVRVEPEMSVVCVEKKLELSEKGSLAAYKNRKPASDFIKIPMNQWRESDVLDFLFTQKFIELMPLCEMFNGRSLIKLYRMCKTQSGQTFTFLNDELKSTYKTKLPFGIYVRFVSAMEQTLATQTPHPVKKTSIKNVPPGPYEEASSQIVYDYAPSISSAPFDLVITSSASSMDILRAVEQYGPNLKRLLNV